MLQGEYGYPVQKSMELLVILGEIYGAERMIEVSQAHIGHPLVSDTVKAVLLYVSELADRGGKFAIPTTTQLLGLDPVLCLQMGISEELHNDYMAFRNAFEKMGAFLCNTCTPYDIGHFPRLGEHIAWMESSAVIYANSVLGARTNREGGPTSIAAALTGRVPLYGYHLDQNRYGTIKVIVRAKLEDIADYGSLGYYAGNIAQDQPPVFVGVPSGATRDQLKALGAAQASSGAVSLYHVVGITPEAMTEEQAFGLQRPGDSNTIEFGEQELQDTMHRLSQTETDSVDWVVFGCPHSSISEIREIVELLSGRKVRSSVDLRICTSIPVKAYADRVGYTAIIEDAGGKMICETCPLNESRNNLKNAGGKTMATNSAKMAHYIPGWWDVAVCFGSTKRCVDAAISGVWR